METTDPAAHWQHVYRSRATDAVSWYQPEPTMSVQLLDAANVSSDASVIDVGGGASTLVDALVARGHHDLTVLDVSSTALDASRARLGPLADHVHWITADALTWEPTRAFDVWHDRAVFHFLVDANDRERYVHLLHAALAPGGCLVIGTFAADGPEQCSGLPVARYSPETLATQFPHFTVIAERREEHHTPGGTVQPFTWLALRAPG